LFLSLDALAMRYRPYPIGIAQPAMADDAYRRCVEAFPPLELFDSYDKILKPGKKYTLFEKENPKAFHGFIRSSPVWRDIYQDVKSDRFVYGVLDAFRRKEIDLGPHYLPPRRRLFKRVKDLSRGRVSPDAARLKARFEFSALPADGDHLNPHTDAPTKIVTLIVSMMRPGEWDAEAFGGGTDVNEPKDDRFAFNQMNEPSGALRGHERRRHLRLRAEPGRDLCQDVQLLALGAADDRARRHGPAQDADDQHRALLVKDGIGAPLVAILFGSFRGGGVGRTMLRAAAGFLGRGFAVDLVVGRKRGDLLAEAPAEARIVVLKRAAKLTTRTYILAADRPGFRTLAKPVLFARKPPGKFRYLPDLVRYLRAARPDAVLAATAPFNIAAVWARRLTKLPCRIVISEHNQLAGGTVGERRWRYDIPPEVLRHGYLQADAVVAVSDGVADDLAGHAGIPRGRITTIYNPVVGPYVAQLAEAPVDHPWLAEGGPPLILGIGMLKPQKDFETLIRAFARLRADRPARLLILGDIRKGNKEAGYRDSLVALTSDLGVGDDVGFPGFVDNPFAFLSRAGLFVLSSRWEGLAIVLIEALACGCPVVSTDCPSGPAEILERGRYGRLVPVGDVVALAAAMRATLEHPPQPEALRRRAEAFTVERAVQRYVDLMFPATTADPGHGPGAP
jgi:glycosyltransferase involved in cell wall biosynthesis